MSEKKVKKGLQGTGLATSHTLWDSYPNLPGCSFSVWQNLCSHWSTYLNDPIARQDIQGLLGGSQPELQFTSFRNRLVDYLHGAGTAINPLPSENAHFYTSDSEALASDWNTALSDVYTVLKAHDLIGSKYGHLKHEQPIGRNESATESGGLERARSKTTT